MSFILSRKLNNRRMSLSKSNIRRSARQLEINIKICSRKSSVGDIDINVLATENAVEERVNG